MTIFKEGKYYLLRDIDEKWEEYSDIYPVKLERDPDKEFTVRMEGELTDYYIESLGENLDETSIFYEEPDCRIYSVKYKIARVNENNFGDSIVLITKIRQEE